MFYFHNLDINVNEWVPVKGCILGYRQMDPMWSVLLLLRPWMGYDYTVIQVEVNPRGKILLNPQFELVFKPQERKNQVIDKYLDPINKDQITKGLKETKTVETCPKEQLKSCFRNPMKTRFKNSDLMGERHKEMFI